MSPKKKPISALKSTQAELKAADEEKRRRYFMGRRDFFEEFETIMAKPPEERKVWFVFGMGAIGKSWLLAELEQKAKERGCVTSRVDLEGITDPEDFFTSLWAGLPEESKKFFGITKKKVKRLEEAKKARLKLEEKALTRFARGAASVLYRAGARGADSIAFGAGIALESAADVAKFVAREMTRETDIQVEQLNKGIIGALQNDLDAGLKKARFKAAIFFDTFERCSPTVVPSVLAVLEYLSRSALIVVAGREDILEYHLPKGKGWEALIETIKLEELNKTEIREWFGLGSDSASASDTKAGVIEGFTKGFPLLIRLVLETMGEKGVEELISADTAKVEKEQQEFFEEKIIKVLETMDKETARSLWYAAFPRRFDGTLFSRYWEACDRRSSADVVMNRVRSIQEYSFVQSEGKWLSCHPFIQSVVRRYLFMNQSDLWRKLNEVSLDYFSSLRGLEPFEETIFHDFQLRPIESFNKFVNTHQQFEKDSEKWRLADILLEDFSSYSAEIPLKVDTDSFFNILNGVNALLLHYPRGDRSTLCLRRISILRKAEGIATNPKNRACVQNSLGIAWGQLPTGDRAQNIETSIEHFKRALQFRTRETFPSDWAMTHNNLGNAYSERIKGNRADNIETAIEHYNATRGVYTREAFPEQWATTHNNEGIVYSDRIKGERAENIETAIEHYKKALQVRTHEAFPEQWATTKNNLGAAYSDRIKSERADNIETAIEHYEKSLQVFSYETFPMHWAATHNNLGNAFSDRIKGVSSENIETAIEHYEKALHVRTREAFPADWAVTQNNLGETYRKRIKGERTENIEMAIEHCEKALQVRTRETFPADWAMTHNNLGIAYSVRIKGGRVDNIETAIEHYEKALQVLTREGFPEQCATTNNNLGGAYLYRIKGERAENIETAIEHYKDALEVLTREAFPEHWATTQNNLGTAYRNRIKGERAENIETAIEYYKKALLVLTREGFPEQWAMMQNNLSNAYSVRIEGERADNIETAIENYQKALKVRTREALPIEYGETKHNLALVFLNDDYPLFEKERLQIALSLLEEACEVLIPEFPDHEDAFKQMAWVRNRLREIG